jgi:hypothetical protein
MITLINLLADVCQKLDGANIRYMLSGSVAMSAYTVARNTRDIDIVIQLNAGNVDEFLALFQTGYYLHEPSIREEIQQKRLFNLIHFESGLKIDFVVLKNTIYRQTEFARRQQANFLDVPVWVVSLEDLIISKIIWIQDYQSELQMRDITQLLLNPDADRNYIQNWCRQLNLQTFKLL